MHSPSRANESQACLFADLGFDAGITVDAEPGAIFELHSERVALQLVRLSKTAGPGLSEVLYREVVGVCVVG